MSAQTSLLTWSALSHVVGLDVAKLHTYADGHCRSSGQNLCAAIVAKIRVDCGVTDRILGLGTQRSQCGHNTTWLSLDAFVKFAVPLHRTAVL